MRRFGCRTLQHPRSQAQCHNHAGPRLRLPLLARGRGLPAGEPAPGAGCDGRAAPRPRPGPRPARRRPRVPLRPAGGGLEPHERWISLQLRTNRIQDATRGLKTRSGCAPDEAAARDHRKDLNLLVTSGTRASPSGRVDAAHAAAGLGGAPARARRGSAVRALVAAKDAARGAAAGRALRRRRARRFERETRLPGPSERGRLGRGRRGRGDARLTPRSAGAGSCGASACRCRCRAGAAAPREVVVLYPRATCSWPSTGAAAATRSSSTRRRGSAASEPLGLRAKLAALRVRPRARAAQRARPRREETQGRGARRRRRLRDTSAPRRRRARMRVPRRGPRRCPPSVTVRPPQRRAPARGPDSTYGAAFFFAFTSCPAIRPTAPCVTDASRRE